MRVEVNSGTEADHNLVAMASSTDPSTGCTVEKHERYQRHPRKQYDLMFLIKVNVQSIKTEGKSLQLGLLTCF